MALTAQDVHDKQFKLVRQTTGYDMDEVDAFLDEVEAELGRLHEQVAAGSPSSGGDEPAGDSAVEQGDSAVEQGATQAARLLELAQRTADEHLAEARRQAEALTVELQQQARDAVAALESQRGELEARVAKLRAFETDIRTRLKGYLEAQLRDLSSFAPSPQGPVE